MRRPPYLVAAGALLIVETAIALFVKGGFIRHTLGDVLVVMLLYAALMGITRMRPAAAAALVFAIAVLVEFAQAFGAVERLGLGDNGLARTVIGVTFSWTDIAAYFAGAVCALMIDSAARRLT